MGGWCKEQYNKDENNKLEGLHQKLDQMEETHWEGQNFSEVVVPQEEEEEEEEVWIQRADFWKWKLSLSCKSYYLCPIIDIDTYTKVNSNNNYYFMYSKF
jgi:hypothetical protein